MIWDLRREEERGKIAFEKPEDRRNRFPIRFRRSEVPKSSPRLPRDFQVGILWIFGSQRCDLFHSFE
jgi:hypothetical protein